MISEQNSDPWSMSKAWPQSNCKIKCTAVRSLANISKECKVVPCIPSLQDNIFLKKSKGMRVS